MTTSIGTRAKLNGRDVVWSGDNFGWQSPASHNKLKNEGKFRIGTREVDNVIRVVKPVTDRIAQFQKKFKEATPWVEPIGRLIDKAMLADDKLPAGVAAKGAAGLAQQAGDAANVDPRIAGLAGMLLVGKVTTGAENPIPRGGRIANAVSTKRTAPPRVIDRRAPLSKSNASSPIAQQASYSMPTKPNPVSVRARVELERGRQNLGGISGKPVGRADAPKPQSQPAKPKPQILEVRKTSEPVLQAPPRRIAARGNRGEAGRGIDYVDDGSGYVPRNVPVRSTSANGSTRIRDRVDLVGRQRPQQTNRVTVHNWEDAPSPYKVNDSAPISVDDLNPTIRQHRRGKTGDVADQQRSFAREQAQIRADQAYERGAVKLQLEYDNNPRPSGVKQIQEANNKQLNAEVRQIRQETEARLRSSNRVAEAIRQRNNQNINGARYDVNESLSDSQRTRMAGAVTNPYGRKLTKQEIHDVLSNDSTYKRGRYQEDRMPVDNRVDVNASQGKKIIKARGLYGYDDVTGLPNGYRDYGDDRPNTIPKLDGVARASGENAKYIDSSGRIRSDVVYSDKLEGYRAGDFQQPRLSNDRIRQTLDRRGNRAVADQREYFRANATDEVVGRDVSQSTGGRIKRIRNDKSATSPQEAADPRFRTGFGYKTPEPDPTLPTGRIPFSENPTTQRVRAQEIELRGLSQKQRFELVQERLRKLFQDRSTKTPVRRAELFESAGNPTSPLFPRGRQPIAMTPFAQGQTIRPRVVTAISNRVPLFDPTWSPSKRATSQLNSSDLEASRIRNAKLNTPKKSTFNIAKELNDGAEFVTIKKWTEKDYLKYARENGLPTVSFTDANGRVSQRDLTPKEVTAIVDKLNENLIKRFPEFGEGGSLANGGEYILPRKEYMSRGGLAEPYNPNNTKNNFVLLEDEPIGGVDVRRQRMWEREIDPETVTKTGRSNAGRIAARLQSRGEPYHRDGVIEPQNHRGKPTMVSDDSADFNHGYSTGKRPEPTLFGTDNRKGTNRSPQRIITNPDGSITRHNVNTGRRGVYDADGNLIKTVPREGNISGISFPVTQSVVDTAVKHAEHFNGKSLANLSDQAKEELLNHLIGKVLDTQMPALRPELRERLIQESLKRSANRRIQMAGQKGNATAQRWWENITTNVYKDLNAAIESQRKYLNYGEVFGVEGAVQQLPMGRNNPSLGLTQKDFDATGDLRNYRQTGRNVGRGRPDDSWSESPVEQARRRRSRQR
jgi:hypothetical protein